MKKHFNQLAKDAVERFKINRGNLVIDIGGNDGTLSKGFEEIGMRTLCIDPAEISLTTQNVGIGVINEFFTSKVAKEVRNKRGKARIIAGTNVFAHIDDLFDFLEGVNILLEDDGILILEFPYLVDLIKKTEFDTIYHEHLSYFAIKPLCYL